MLLASSLLALLLLPDPAMAGEPVLLPDFTPGTVSEFTLAALLQEQTETALAKGGHVVLLDDMVLNLVGPTLDGCADLPGCPREALGKVPARFGVVVRVRRDGAKVFADVALFEKTGDRPLEERTFEVVGGQEAEFGRAVADMIDDLAGVMGPADASDLIAAARLVSDYPSGGSKPSPNEREPVPETPSEKQPTNPTSAPPLPPPDPPPPDPTAKPELPLSDDAKVEAALADTEYTERNLVGVRRSFLESGMDVRDWAYKQTPHAGRAIIEVRGGLGIGDVDRIAHVRTTVTGGQQEQWFQEGPAQGQRVRGELFAGYAPSAWVDVGALVGLQYGQRTLDSGWTDDEGNAGQSADSVQAVQFDLQPRVRVYPVRTGPVKPWIFAGAHLRFFDRWRIRDVGGFEYGQPPGGFVAGPVGGVGMLFDPSPIVGFFVEGSGSYHLGLRAAAVQNGGDMRPANAPAAVEAAFYTIAVSGGVQFRL